MSDISRLELENAGLNLGSNTVSCWKKKSPLWSECLTPENSCCNPNHSLPVEGDGVSSWGLWEEITS